MSFTSHWWCARLKILKQAWIFSASPTITPPGSCIHRKAINKDKPLSCRFLFLPRIKRIRRIGLVSFPQAYALAARWWCSSMQASLPAWTSPPVWSAVVRRKGIKSRMLPRGQESVRLLFNSCPRTGVAFVMIVLLWCPASGRICVSLSEGNAKTGLEQIPVTYSRKACGPHKSTFTTPRKSVQSVKSVKSVVKIRTTSALVPGGHYFE